MALSHKARRRWSLVVLLVALPLYIVVAVTLTDWLRARFDGLPMLVELVIFIGLGILWILPLKPVFRGVGQADPDDKG
ncbi:DUF2842 domain-containing protein [Ruegeria pomeroyi]|jgi:Ca2+/H+ antiporter|uniref:DUF2842 domain-containing protein n=2 Tax=Ruegeria pomeroyi TaxID=89184 RepID=Q5LTU5_RUEPO|nr:DUF2842 domain-containing protein [Ruegeria pomeroyi]AAV94606.1 hypothetical protein SPO1317 [Ruegeria pomeroyi DSS-3]NVK98448.1 DUF2842 domain-containing protein [Ruegeria pomeroyi]NVL02306.1 DUF2842 domain-containing protein [Ruegeria pomeroyi]QWV08187.1 DUF2842 domain-containing protein [Ruegeria pomeroyi]